MLGMQNAVFLSYLQLATTPLARREGIGTNLSSCQSQPLLPVPYISIPLT